MHVEIILIEKLERTSLLCVMELIMFEKYHYLTLCGQFADGMMSGSWIRRR